MSEQAYTLSDHLWAFIGITMVIAIASGVFTLGFSYLFSERENIVLFRMPVFLWSFATLMVLNVFCQKLLVTILGGMLHFVFGAFDHRR